MKQQLKKLGIFLICAVVCTTGIKAQCGPNGTNPAGQDCINTLITAVPFLRIVPDARSGGMGDVGIGISPDANAMHYNPSKLAFVKEDLGISVTYTPWLRALGLKDVYLAYLSAFKQIDERQTVGFGLRYFSLGDIAFTDEQGQPLGNGRPNEFEISAAYARQLSPNFSGSIALKYIYSNLASGQEVDGIPIEAGQAVGADISFTYLSDLKVGQYDSEIRVGLALSNLGTKITYTDSANKDYIPANLGLGAALDINIDDFNKITIAADINKLLVPSPIPPANENYDADADGIPDYKQKSVISSMLGSFSDGVGNNEELRELMYSVGIEYWYDEQFAVRAGYYDEHSTKGNRKFFTVGLGIKYNIFGINFSYLVPTTNQRNPLDNTLRFSLLFDFGALSIDDNS